MKKIVLLIAIIPVAVFGFSQKKTIAENFLNNLGDTVIVSGKIYGGAFLNHVVTKPTFLNLGDTSPSHRLIIRIEPEDRDKFPSPPEIFFLNKVVQVTGRLQEYKGSPLIRISEPGMIKSGNDLVDTTSSTDNNYTRVGTIERSNKDSIKQPHKIIIDSALQTIKPNAVLQSAWIKSVTEKAAEEKKVNVRLVQKVMDLRTAPFNDAPVIAQLHPGILISILYTSKKWSYISVGSIDGFNNVNGFIKHKRFRHLVKASVK